MTERKDAFAGFVGEKFSFSPDWIPAEDCSAWLKTRRGRKRDSEAASLEADLARPEAFGAACARLRQLAKAGSGYASWLLGDRLARGEGLEKDEEAARPLLEKAAAAGIGPACWRLNCLDGDEAADSDLLRRGLAAGSIRCARALALAWTEGGLRLDKKEAGRVFDLLLDAARRGSWPCLDALLPLVERTPKLMDRPREYMVVLAMLAVAAGSGIVPAMAHLGRLAQTQPVPRPAEGSKGWLEQAWDGGSVEAALILSEQAMTDDRPEEAIRLLAPGLDTHDCRTLYLAGDVWYRIAEDGKDAAKAVETLLQAIREGAGDFAAERAWHMCLALNAEETGLRKDGLTLLRAAAEEGSRTALVKLAHLRLLDLTGEEDSVQKGLDLLESLRDSDARACGMLAETYMFALYRTAPDIERGLALALEGCAGDDLRSTALLLLNRKSLLGGKVCADNPVSERNCQNALLFLARQHEPMMLADNALSRLSEPGLQVQDHERTGQMLASCMLQSIASRDMAALTLLAAGAAGFGENAATRTAARAFSDFFRIGNTPLGSFTSWQQVVSFALSVCAEPEGAMSVLIEAHDGGSGFSRGAGDFKGSAAKRNGSARRRAERRKARKKRK